MIGVKSPSPNLKVTYREARRDERRPGVAGRQWRIESTLASNETTSAGIDGAFRELPGVTKTTSIPRRGK